MTSREIAGDDTGVSAHGLFHPEPSWPAPLALNRPSTYSTCWRPPPGVQGHRGGGLGGPGRSLRTAPVQIGPSSWRENHRPESRMREIRLSGSEGGGTRTTRSLLPL